MTVKEKIISFAWQHILLLFALYIMTLGIALCVKSMLGSSVISVLPYVFHDAGTNGQVPALTIGQYTFIMNALLVVGQIGILRRQFEPVQLFQLLVGFVFGLLIDLNMNLISWLQPIALWEKATAQLVGCTILAAGIAFEVRCGSITMPGEGFPVAVSKMLNARISKSENHCRHFTRHFGNYIQLCIFRKVAIVHHRTGHIICHVLCRMGRTDCQSSLEVVRPCTPVSPGFRRYIYGLARYIYRK